MAIWPQELLDRMPVVTHVHSQANHTEHDCQGEQSLQEIDLMARDLGVKYVWVTNHTSNPGVGRSHHVTADSELGQSVLHTLGDINAYSKRGTTILWSGLEASLLPDGPDAADELLAEADFNIGSIHGSVPQTPAEIEQLFEVAFANPFIRVLGHPTRYIENVVGIPWSRIFDRANETATAVELNYNAFHTYGPTKYHRKGDQATAGKLLANWERWLHAVAVSGVPVVVSLDIHNAGMWPTPEPEKDWMPSVQQVLDFYGLIDAAGIERTSITNGNADRFCNFYMPL